MQATTQFRVLDVVNVGGHADIQHRGVAAVGLHVLEMLLGVPGAAGDFFELEPVGNVLLGTADNALLQCGGRQAEALHMRLIGELEALAAVGRGDDPRRQVFELRRNTVNPGAWWLVDMRVGGNHIVFHRG